MNLAELELIKCPIPIYYVIQCFFTAIQHNVDQGTDFKSLKRQSFTQNKHLSVFHVKQK